MNRGQKQAIAADHIFDGEGVHRHSAVIVEEGIIVAIAPRRELPMAMPVQAMPEGTWLAPGFVDVQVNGGGDVLFNDDPTPTGIERIVAAHRRFGTTSLLPTLISDTPEKMRAALGAVQDFASARSGVLGIHLEGPFLSPEKPGAHDPAMIRRLGQHDLDLLTAPRPTITVATVAPEVLSDGSVARLVSAGVRVALGHSMASYAQTKRALKEGMTGFTHLFNAMRPMGSREPGPIAAALETPSAWFGMIVDGMHVDPAMLRLALRGLARPMLVTDAMPPVGGSQSKFLLRGEEVCVQGGACVGKDGTLSGTALSMADAVRNCINLLDVPLTAALRFASAEPADFLGLGHALGRLKPGYRADMVALRADDIRVLATWVAGCPEDGGPK
jgi:N-acetylglucosamine-6-phosphate deacetylase